VLEVLSCSVVLILDGFNGGDVISTSSCISSTVTHALFVGGGGLVPELMLEALVLVLVGFHFQRFLASEAIQLPQDGTVFIGKMAASCK
jgi:hypothetical protein